MILKYNSSVKTRLDMFLLDSLKDYTRSFIKNLITDKKVLVNKNPVKAGYILKPNDEVQVEDLAPVETNILPEDIDIDIVYEDKDIVVVNKKQGMVVHPAGKLKSNTLVNALLYKVKDLSGIGGKIRPGIVHRIDKDTSGLLVVAKNDFSHLNLQKQIQNKTCHRVYLAVCYGRFKNGEGDIENYLARGKTRHDKIFVVNKNDGKYAKTHYKELKYNSKFSLVEFTLYTGRTHQIRVHSAYYHHEIVGDKLYGREENFNLNGQLLHAYKLEFIHPRTNKKMSFTSKLPDYFEEFLKKHDLM